MDFLNAVDIHKSFGEQEVLKGVNLNLKKGEQVAIQGASGSGKSTLLYLVGGLDRPSRGELLLEGTNYQAMSDEQLAHFRNQKVGFVFQFHFLLPSMSCRENIFLPAKIGDSASPGLEDRIQALASLLGVDHCMEKYPYELSGGEQQRINLIRALSLKPPLLLCDEPTGNLDSKNSQRVCSLIREMALENESTLLFVTHDQSLASQFPTRLQMQDGQLLH